MSFTQTVCAKTKIHITNSILSFCQYAHNLTIKAYPFQTNFVHVLIDKWSCFSTLIFWNNKHISTLSYLTFSFNLWSFFEHPPFHAALNQNTVCCLNVRYHKQHFEQLSDNPPSIVQSLLANITTSIIVQMATMSSACSYQHWLEFQNRTQVHPLNNMKYCLLL